MASTRRSYNGTRRRLVLAFDIGVVYSSISYSILDPGKAPDVIPVTRFPGHEYVSRAYKIPTVIYYDQQGSVRAVGAEATREDIYEDAEDGNWIKAEWFTLHLRPKTGASKNIHEHVPPLPRNKSVVDVFADFLRYMLQCASSYIQDTHPNGDVLWAEVKDDTDFILSHPNGWDAKPEGQMRQAALLAGLVSDTPGGHAGVIFVTEGEALLHQAFWGLGHDLKQEKCLVIVDEARGTINTSAYRCNREDAFHNCEEVAAPTCHYEGSVFVGLRAKVFLDAFLKDSAFIDDLDHILCCFQETTMVKFNNEHEDQYIKFGSTRDNDPRVSIRFGRLKLPGSDVASFFEPSIKCIIDAVLEQRQINKTSLRQVILLGEMGTHDWVFNKVFSSLQQFGLNVLRLEQDCNLKTVSDGSICFYLDHFVRFHVSKYAYGCFGPIPYVPIDLEHRERSAQIVKAPSGKIMVNDCFTVIFPKSTRILVTEEFRYSFYREAHCRWELNEITSSIWCYSGNDAHPRWKDIDTIHYKQLCTVITDLSHLPLEPMRNPEGYIYYRINYDVVLIFSLTDTKVQIAWKENGIERRSPPEILSGHDATHSQDGDGRD